MQQHDYFKEPTLVRPLLNGWGGKLGLRVLAEDPFKGSASKSLSSTIPGEASLLGWIFPDGCWTGWQAGRLPARRYRPMLCWVVVLIDLSGWRGRNFSSRKLLLK